MYIIFIVFYVMFFCSAPLLSSIISNAIQIHFVIVILLWVWLSLSVQSIASKTRIRNH